MTATPATATPTLGMLSIDCADAGIAADFWSQLMGWEIAMIGDGYAMLTGGGVRVGFGSVPDYEAPAWPNPRGSKQFHLDLACHDVAAVEARAVELGATVAEPQGGKTWRVLVDPSGHPFCLTDAKNWG
ncbi:MAG: VOC family protein [Actinomycetota bacterium]|nr:VOC family protein [Actinomycetota bacterium]